MATPPTGQRTGESTEQESKEHGATRSVLVRLPPPQLRRRFPIHRQQRGDHACVPALCSGRRGGRVGIPSGGAGGGAGRPSSLFPRLPVQSGRHAPAFRRRRPPAVHQARTFSAEARRRGHHETILHTGQHYDEGMSARFFRELNIPEPDINLGVGSGSHGAMTARALEGIERELQERKPDLVIVFGDTNSTLAGALAAAKLHVPVAHVEAGLRSFNRSMPEEINRVLTDHAADVLLAPNETAMHNLAAEGLANRSANVGDIMVDALYTVRETAPGAASVLRELRDRGGVLFPVTVHRASNTDDPVALRGIFAGLEGAEAIVFPVHPRTRAAIAAHGVDLPDNVRPVEPLGYAQLVSLAAEARTVITDSGGLQKEAYLLETPCITLRDDTEWTETVDLGWNVLAGADPGRIRNALASPPRGNQHPPVYGEGHAASAILDALEARFI
ncbi:MAG: UDP-N-acetylglucosamine 2-epimerase (non-hydrolyzing) [Dehalococcoidia bacterium]|nr:UDP-N-acetylglucosamine 2-epimerase (non-hydrolyzing) [Dehalococcoidia bacterium]